jgi:hypothetical protein
MWAGISGPSMREKQRQFFSGPKVLRLRSGAMPAGQFCSGAWGDVWTGT